jgi:hypothetical protein
VVRLQAVTDKMVRNQFLTAKAQPVVVVALELLRAKAATA